ncbi:SCO family protein [Roseateles cellulosilyticus]|uniref:SCO family protein n=1 Tax=Pelomonas cellulosilytica TaxID=2906762 RepID=A0ABS8XPF3_9BURK|nr:SCO family protein [Pelomonas sp. P8]MCE4553537.1 SCO family protein [Pelomonas sp. P8]
MNRRSLLASLALAAVPAWALPGDSVYQLDAKLTDQRGQPVRLDVGRGQPVLVSMFYTSCQFVCPMLIEAAQATQAALPANERQKVKVLLISFDPARDTPEKLAAMAKERGLDSSQWTLARTDPATVRKIAALLKFQYRALPDGEFNHSAELILLDGEGRVATRTTMLAGADERVVGAVRKQLALRQP